MSTQTLSVPTVRNDGEGPSFFSQREIQLSGDDWRRLSDRIPAENFRLRTSSPDYHSAFHVAGDPTLLIILSGVVSIELRNGERRDFSAGELFVAEDYLLQNQEFDQMKHGHKAKVISDEPLVALHLKLSVR